MSSLPLQLVTVNLDNGRTGMFVGMPLVEEQASGEARQVEEIWFSSIKAVPGDLTVIQLLKLVRAHLMRHASTLH